MLNFFMPCVGDYGSGASGMMGYGFGGGVFGGVMMILWWGVIIVGAIVLIRWVVAQTKQGGGAGGKAPLDILKERYAKGEINKEEFEMKKRDLE